MRGFFATPPLVMFRVRSVVSCQTVSFLLSTCLITGLAMPLIPLRHSCLGRDYVESLYRHWSSGVLTSQMGVTQECWAGIASGGVVSVCNFEVRLEEVKQPELETIRKSAGKRNVSRSRWVVIFISEMTGGADCPWTGS